MDLDSIDLCVDTALSWDGRFPPPGKGDFLIMLDGPEGPRTVLVSSRYTAPTDAQDAESIALDAANERWGDGHWFVEFERCEDAHPSDATELSLCIDCAQYLANDELPEDRPELADEIAEWWPASQFVLTVDSGDDADLGFHAGGCDCCSSKLGGDRVRGWAWERK